MNVTQADIDALTESWDKISKEAEIYFDRVHHILVREAGGVEQLERYEIPVRPEFVVEADQGTVANLNKEVPKFFVRLIEMSKASPVISDIDRTDLQFSMRELLASLRFHRYQHWTTHVLSDEDRVLGVNPAGQGEDECGLTKAFNQFTEARDNVQRVIDLLVPSDTTEATAIARSETANIKQYRPNTAFVMMWISRENPELEDVNNCIKEAFKDFGITAVRADEIEHSELITNKILAEIATSEFLIADLTGGRTSVYYEVGYAHALKKRPILFRKAGERLGFDLTGHNCPEYKNITDLRTKLRKRLSSLTNKSEPE